jgi:hypothetical protein
MRRLLGSERSSRYLGRLLNAAQIGSRSAALEYEASLLQEGYHVFSPVRIEPRCVVVKIHLVSCSEECMTSPAKPMDSTLIYFYSEIRAETREIRRSTNKVDCQ